MEFERCCDPNEVRAFCVCEPSCNCNCEYCDCGTPEQLEEEGVIKYMKIEGGCQFFLLD